MTHQRISKGAEEPECPQHDLMGCEKNRGGEAIDSGQCERAMVIISLVNLKVVLLVIVLVAELLLPQASLTHLLMVLVHTNRQQK